MKRVLLVLGAGALLALAIPAVLRMLESDEAAIRRLLRSAAASFDDTHLAGCLRPFAEDYRDTTRDLDRAMLTQVLRAVFLREIDPQTKAFRFRARLPEQDLAVTPIEGGGCSATFTLHLERRTGDGWEPVWVLRVAAVLQEIDGWRVVTSSHETVEGDAPR